MGSIGDIFNAFKRKTTINIVIVICRHETDNPIRIATVGNTLWVDPLEEKNGTRLPICMTKC